MKTLMNGRWTDREEEKQSNDGSFKRKDTEFRNWITPDGSLEKREWVVSKQRVIDTICMSLCLSLGSPNPDI